MNKSQGRKAQITVVKLSKSFTDEAKKVPARANKKTRKVKLATQRILSGAKKKLKKITNKSSKTLRNAKDKVYATEKEIMEYVKKNPVKSASAVALVGLIAGFVSHFNKRK